MTYWQRVMPCDWCLQSMAVKIIQAILKVSTEISEPAQVETLLDFIKPLITDIPGVEVDDEVGNCHTDVEVYCLPTGCL